MKKILLSVLIVLMLALCCIVILNGINILGFEVLGFNQIKEKNSQLESTIDKATTLASADYPQTLKDIETDLKKLKEEKKTYEGLVNVSTGDEVQSANQSQKYEIEYLWTQVGNIATSEGIELKMDLVSGTGENIYNLNFSVKGTYIGIADFIYDIENDSALGFKIENFSMTPGSGEQLQATFTCKNIEIKELAAGSTKSETDANNKNNNNNTVNKTNTTNTTASNTASNTANKSNTTSNTVNTSNTTSNANDPMNIDYTTNTTR